MITFVYVDHLGGPGGAAMYKHGKLRVLITTDNGRLHMSISHRNRLPMWDEIGQARRQLLPPDVHFCIPHPPEKYWFNLHSYTLHLVEIHDEPLTSLWEAEGELAKQMGVGKPDW